MMTLLLQLITNYVFGLACQTIPDVREVGVTCRRRSQFIRPLRESTPIRSSSDESSNADTTDSTFQIATPVKTDHEDEYVFISNNVYIDISSIKYNFQGH
jgi:hypothetical protein